ncbi:MAG: hypothetical protein CM1200mP2_12510 [Planctomycetaceae bacterium]|nr:MAG: hypothetical protein CM1200mP2_12510 [Planctomycetaceae bacterium]
MGGYGVDATRRPGWPGTWKRTGKTEAGFLHEELHHTPERVRGRVATPFFPPSASRILVDNGGENPKAVCRGGRVLACFFGHKHRSRWTVYDDTHYLTMAATHFNAVSPRSRSPTRWRSRATADSGLTDCHSPSGLRDRLVGAVLKAIPESSAPTPASPNCWQRSK